MIRYGLSALSLIGTLFFPWGYTLILTIIASYVVPVTALLVGILYDILYHVPGAYPIPATIIGALISLTMIVARRFVQTYIADFS